VKVVRL